MTWTNADGLEVLMHGEQGNVNGSGSTVSGEGGQLVAELDLTALSTTPEALDAFVPAGSFITSAYLVAEVAAVGGTSVTVGLYTAAGVAIDADGIDAAVATAALAANKAVVADGALVAGVDTVGAANAYLGATAAGTYTAGKVKVVIDYV